MKERRNKDSFQVKNGFVHLSWQASCVRVAARAPWAAVFLIRSTVSSSIFDPDHREQQYFLIRGTVSSSIFNPEHREQQYF